MNYILDTVVVSELVAPRPNQAVLTWLAAVPEEQLYLSVITIGELKTGIEMLPSSRRRQALQVWLEAELVPRFGQRLLPLDAGVMFAWGALTARLAKRGRPLPAIDSLIAATALYGDMTVATRNINDFDETDVRLVNPWHEAG